MGRPSVRNLRRREIALAFERALARHGLGDATVVAIAEEAGVAPGLIHHHFRDREDLVAALIESLLARFRKQQEAPKAPAQALLAYMDAALALKGSDGQRAAKAWVGIFAEGIRSRRVQNILQRTLRRELARLQTLLDELDYDPRQAERTAAGLVSLILGCLVFGALLPGRAKGFAAPFAREVVLSLLPPDVEKSPDDSLSRTEGPNPTSDRKSPRSDG